MDPRAIYPIWRIKQNVIKINDHELINQLPQELKILVAYYLQYVPGEIWKHSMGEDKKIAESLGNYETLEKAEKELLKGNEQITENKNLLITPKENYPIKLEIKRIGQLLYIEFIGIMDQKRRIDEYKIGKKGKIEFSRRI